VDGAEIINCTLAFVSIYMKKTGTAEIDADVTSLFQEHSRR
jgi:hypothetical protein